MSYPMLVRRVARVLPAILCGAAMACASGPTDPIPGEGRQMEPVPGPPVIYRPSPQQPTNDVSAARISRS
jgi:hypothetical protein